MKRYGKPRAKPGEIKMQWGKIPNNRPDMCFVWGEGTDPCDARMLRGYFCDKQHIPIKNIFIDSMFENLEKRGYDLTTLKFSIQKKKK